MWKHKNPWFIINSPLRDSIKKTGSGTASSILRPIPNHLWRFP